MTDLADSKCERCAALLLPSENRCSNCWWPGLFPNVKAAASDADALRNRLREVNLGVGNENLVRLRQAAVKQALETKSVVLCRHASDVIRILESDKFVYSNYYLQIAGEVRRPDASAWDRRRRVADQVFFPGYAEDIRFGILACEGADPPANYGNCAIVLDEQAIAHRVSFFETNTTLWCMGADRESGDTLTPPAGSRAAWTNVADLVAVKHLSSLGDNPTAADVAVVLVATGGDTSADDFIEAHIFGGFTNRAIVSVSYDPAEDDAVTAQYFAAKLRALCNQNEISLQIQTTGDSSEMLD